MIKANNSKEVKYIYRKDADDKITNVSLIKNNDGDIVYIDPVKISGLNSYGDRVCEYQGLIPGNTLNYTMGDALKSKNGITFKTGSKTTSGELNIVDSIQAIKIHNFLCLDTSSLNYNKIYVDSTKITQKLYFKIYVAHTQNTSTRKYTDNICVKLFDIQTYKNNVLQSSTNLLADVSVDVYLYGGGLNGGTSSYTAKFTKGKTEGTVVILVSRSDLTTNSTVYKYYPTRNESNAIEIPSGADNAKDMVQPYYPYTSETEEEGNYISIASINRNPTQVTVKINTTEIKVPTTKQNSYYCYDDGAGPNSENINSISLYLWVQPKSGLWASCVADYFKYDVNNDNMTYLTSLPTEPQKIYDSETITSIPKLVLDVNPNGHHPVIRDKSSGEGYVSTGLFYHYIKKTT